MNKFLKWFLLPVTFLCLELLFASGADDRGASSATAAEGDPDYFGEDVRDGHFEHYLNCDRIDFRFGGIETGDITAWAELQVARLRAFERNVAEIYRTSFEGRDAPSNRTWAMRRNVAIGAVKFFYQRRGERLRETAVIPVPLLFFDSHTYYSAAQQQSILDFYPDALLRADGQTPLRPAFFTTEWNWEGRQVLSENPANFARKAQDFIGFFLGRFPLPDATGRGSRYNASPAYARATLALATLGDRIRALPEASRGLDEMFAARVPVTDIGFAMHSEIAFIEHMRTNLYWYMPPDEMRGARVVGAVFIIVTTRDPCEGCSYYLRELSREGQDWLRDESTVEKPVIQPLITIVGTREFTPGPRGTRARELRCPASAMNLTESIYKYILMKK